MSQFFKLVITVLNILWILAALCALLVSEGDRDRGTTFLNCTLIYTMVMNLIFLWR